MGLWRRRIPFVLVLITALLAALPVLAFLQYRWLGQVSQAERERMQTNLRHAIQQFRQDFDRELARTYLHFQSERPLTQAEIGSHFSGLLADWRAKSTNARLVSDLYWVDTNQSPQATLKRFDPETARPAPVEWPAEFEAWRDRINRRDGTPDTGMHAFQFFLGEVSRKHSTPSKREIMVSGGGTRSEQRTDERLSPFVRLLRRQDEGYSGPSQRIIEDGPALVIPISSLHRGPGAMDSSVPTSKGYILARLNLDYLRSEFIPTLVRKYFQTEQGLDYQVVVVSRRDKEKVIYQSSPAAIAGIASTNDGSAGLLALRPEDFGLLLEERLATSKSLVQDHLERPDRVTMRVVSSEVNKLPASANDVVSELDGYWQVLLKHKAGSLEAAVGSVRRRSIGISLGVLAFLGASIVLLLVSTRRAQRLAEQQMDFVAGVSHELRTPLAVIRSAAENLADGYVGSPEHIKKYGALIRDEGRRLTDMVEQVLEVAGVQSGRRSYQLRPVDPGLILEQAVGASNLLISESGFEVDLQLEEHLPMISADGPALCRAIQNLISNAIKYCGGNRRLRIRAGFEKLDGKEEVRIEIEDFGIGISASDLPHIFEPFFRGREVAAAQIHGSGLGLSLVKHIVELHSGRIAVESIEGKGTTFTLSLPAANSAEADVEVVEGYEQTNPAH